MAKINKNTQFLIKCAIQRGVTCFGITAPHSDDMLRGRVRRYDVTGGIREITAAYERTGGGSIWMCPAADPGAPTSGFDKALDGPSAAESAGLLYLPIRCETTEVRDAARGVLLGCGISDMMDLPGRVLLAPISASIDDLPRVQTMIDALRIVVGGGIGHTSMIDYYDISAVSSPDAVDATPRSYDPPQILASLIEDAGNAFVHDDDYPGGDCTNFSLAGYLEDHGIDILPDIGHEEIFGFRRYRTRYGVVLEHMLNGGMTLIPAVGSKIRTWRELRAEAESGITDEDRQAAMDAVTHLRETNHDGEAEWLTALDYLHHIDDEPEDEYIPTGISTYDRKYIGIPVAGLTIIGGITSNGKSAVVSQIVVNMIQAGHRIAIYSGEYRCKHYQRLLHCVAAGRGGVVKIIQQHQHPEDPDASYEWQAKRSLLPKISTWLAGCTLDEKPIPGAGCYFQYNSDMLPNDPDTLLKKVRERYTKDRCDVIVIDNLMKLGLTQRGEDANNRLNLFIEALSRMAKVDKIAIIVVAHPTKIKGLLDSNDLQGGSQVGQTVDRVIYVYKNSDSFLAAYKYEHPGRTIDPGDGYMVVVKDRYVGPNSDLFIPFFFEPGSCRITGTRGESMTYGWQAPGRK